MIPQQTIELFGGEWLFWAMRLGDLLVLLGCAGIATILIPFARAAPTERKAVVRYSFVTFITFIAIYHLILLGSLVFDVWIALTAIKLATGLFACGVYAVYLRHYR